MTKIRDCASVTYTPPAPPNYRRRPATIVSTRTKPKTLVRVDPRVLEIALELAEGDRGRLVINLDGSVTVTNHTRSQP